MIYLAIDPGKSGAIAWSTGGGWPTGNGIQVREMPDNIHDLVKLIRELRDRHEIMACLEHVHAFPGQGVSTMFTFGREYGKCEAVLAAFGCAIHDVEPRAWMAAMSTKRKKAFASATEWKKHLRAIALRLHPDVQTSLQCADALLMLHWFIGQQTGGRP